RRTDKTRCHYRSGRRVHRHDAAAERVPRPTVAGPQNGAGATTPRPQGAVTAAGPDDVHARPGGRPPGRMSAAVVGGDLHARLRPGRARSAGPPQGLPSVPVAAPVRAP